MPRTPRNRLASPSASSPNRASAADGAAGRWLRVWRGRAGSRRADALRCCGLSASVRPVAAFGCASRSDAGLAMLLRSILLLQQISTWPLGASESGFPCMIREGLHAARSMQAFVVLGGCWGSRGSGVQVMRRRFSLSDAAEHDAQDDDDRRERDEQVAPHELEPCAYGLLSSHLSLF